MSLNNNQNSVTFKLEYNTAKTVKFNYLVIYL